MWLISSGMPQRVLLKKDNNGYRRDEEFDSPPPSPNADFQQASALAPAQMDTREHGSGRLCFCL